MGTPIINPPQSAILGMHAINKRPVVVNDQVVIRYATAQHAYVDDASFPPSLTLGVPPRLTALSRPIMYLALTYDHRLIDGREAVTFLRHIKHNIEDPRRLLLDL